MFRALQNIIRGKNFLHQFTKIKFCLHITIHFTIYFFNKYYTNLNVKGIFPKRLSTSLKKAEGINKTNNLNIT